MYTNAMYTKRRVYTLAQYDRAFIHQSTPMYIDLQHENSVKYLMNYEFECVSNLSQTNDFFSEVFFFHFLSFFLKKKTKKQTDTRYFFQQSLHMNNRHVYTHTHIHAHIHA